MDEMDDWEDGSLTPVLSMGQLPSCWDDENVDENKVKESWEDEDESTWVDVKSPPLGESTEKVVSKASEKKGKIAAGEKEDELNAVEEKLCQLRLVEKADSGSNGDQFAESCTDKSLDNFIPKSESDFFEYAELISNKLRANEHSRYYLGLLKDVMRFSMKALSAADAKEVANSVAVVANERLKAEREAYGRKRKTAGRLLVAKADSGSNDDQFAESCTDKSLDNFIPKSESDFFEYAELISNKLRANEHSCYYLGLLKDVMRFSMKALSAAAAKEVANSVAEVANERLKAEREAQGRKWKTAAPKKKNVYVEKEECTTSLDAYDALDVYEDYFSM